MSKPYSLIQKNQFITEIKVYKIIIKSGDCLRLLKKYDIAIKTYDEAIKLNSKDALCFNNKGIPIENQ